MITSECSGYSVDNLNTKTLDQAQGDFEELFIRIRDMMIGRDNNDTLQDSDLDACHQIARNLSQHFKKNLRIKKKDLKRGMLVKLDDRDWSDFVDTSNIGMVMSWEGKRVDVLFINGVREEHWIWSLREVGDSWRSC